MNITTFSKRVGLSPHTIRYYEKIGLFNHVQRLANGHRHFTEKDIEWAKFIQRLKETDMPLVEIQQYAKLRSQGNTTLESRQTLLENHAKALQTKLNAQQQHLKKLNEKIAFYKAQTILENNH
ncbi:MerR family transcriptional regulator [Hydrogenovibrio sp. JE_KL2]|uniref:MerR family transcriptional regulator n=1 Tax=Hydrogenovibrio sp. JE_KL2 TaxID=2651188 RepID=UPI00128C2D7C|nr:MerR family transcriptional regulator [Hydrogenovibrio sp. JE_KL2]MPQ75873.1 MerR family transcriptional regulator [Hydrogenovibrio sp. JE_KL2]